MASGTFLVGVFGQYKLLLLLLSQQMICYLLLIHVASHTFCITKSTCSSFSWPPGLLALHVAVNMLRMMNSFHLIHV